MGRPWIVRKNGIIAKGKQKNLCRKMKIALILTAILVLNPQLKTTRNLLAGEMGGFDIEVYPGGSSEEGWNGC